MCARLLRARIVPTHGTRPHHLHIHDRGTALVLRVCLGLFWRQLCCTSPKSLTVATIHTLCSKKVLLLQNWATIDPHTSFLRS